MTARGTGRGRRLGLTRDKVIAKALTMIDRDGPDAFSLRKLAAELDIENMSLYNHVPNKDALLDGVAEALLSEVDFSGTDTAPGRIGFARTASSSAPPPSGTARRSP